MTREIDSQIENIVPAPVTAERLATCTSEEDFTGLAVDLLAEVGSFICVAACLLAGGTKCWTRNQAIVAGNVVRLYKLISALLDQTCQKRRETTFIFGRLAFETIVNIRYLITFASPALFDSYISDILYATKNDCITASERTSRRAAARNSPSSGVCWYPSSGQSEHQVCRFRRSHLPTRRIGVGRTCSIARRR